MNANSWSRLCHAALRPWPFGPPLRGRAPRGAAQAPAAREATRPARYTPANGPRSGGQATAPVGGLAWLQSSLYG